MPSFLKDREKRRLESLCASKAILKSRSSGLLDMTNRISTSREMENDDSSVCTRMTLNEELDNGTNGYITKINELKIFTKKKKREAKAKTLKDEWRKEQNSLNNAMDNAEQELCNVLEVMVLHNPGDREVQGIVELNDAMDTSLKESKTELEEQLGEIKGLLKMRDNSLLKLMEGQTENREHEERCNKVNSIFADCLMQLRTSTSQHWQALGDEERGLTVVLAQERASFSRMLRDERHEAQNRDMDACLAELEDDDSSVLLAIEEWHAKLSTLDRSHGALCKQMEEEKTVLTRVYEEEAKLKQEGGVQEVGIQRRDGPTTANEQEKEESDDWKHFAEEGEAEPTIKEEKTTVKESMVPPSASDIGPQSSSGPWSQEEHMAFVKTFRRFNAQGGARKTLIQQWLTILPDKSREEVLRHEVWHRGCRAIAEKVKAATATYETSRAVILSSAKGAIAEVREERARVRLEEKERQRQERERLMIHEHLMELREARRVENETASEEEAQREEERARLERLRREQWELEQEARKSLVAKFQNARRERSEREAAEAEATRQKQEAAMRELIEQNRGHVERRELLRLEKEQDKVRRLAQKAEEEAQRLELLMKLAASVPYWDAVENATSQLDHVTAAAKAQEWVQPEQLTRGFLESYGFGDKKIVRDTRFRLAEALREAGIAQSRVAAEVVQRFNPRPHLAIHGILNR